MEKFAKEKFPPCIKSILISSGYDKLNSLRQIDAEKVNEIEMFVNENKDLINNLKCCFKDQYQKPGEFRFLPGHKALILGISKQIDQIEQMKSLVRKKTTKDPSSKSLSDADLKRKLVSNLLKYTGKLNYQFPDEAISERNIMDFKRGLENDDYVCKCRFSCSVCSKNFPLVYKSFWMTSNVTLHLKKHIEADKTVE